MKIGMALSRADVDSPVAEHFGKAKWILFAEPPESFELVRNTGLDGRWVARELQARGCTDVIVRGLGPGAWAHVRVAGMRVWVAGEDEPARALIGKLEAGGLRALAPEDVARHAHPAASAAHG